jgi:5-keto 4-deoxyuronate isomerase
MNSEQGYADYMTARDYLMSGTAARQINFDSCDLCQPASFYPGR